MKQETDKFVELKKRLAREFCKARKEKGLTQLQVCDTGVITRKIILSLEDGTGTFRLEHLLNLIRFYGMDPDRVFDIIKEYIN